MRADDLIDAIGNIDPIYVEEAEIVKMRRKPPYPILISAAACICILAAVQQIGLLQTGRSGSNYALQEEIAAPEAENQEMTLDKGMLTDEEMAADVEMEPGMEEEGMASGSSQTQKELDDKEEKTEISDLSEDSLNQIQKTLGEDGQLARAEAAEDTIVINQIEELQATVIDIKAPEEIKSITIEELEGYYAVTIIPDNLPEDLKLTQKEQGYKIGYDKEGKVVEDSNQIIYENQKGSRNLKISARTVDTGEIISFVDNTLQESTIKDTRVTIGYCKNDEGGYYIAIYKVDGVTLTVESMNLSQEEFTAVLRGLLQ